MNLWPNYIYIYTHTQTHTRAGDRKIKCNKYIFLISTCKIENENIIKGAIWRGGHNLKYIFCIFEKSRGEHNNWDCQ